MRSSPNAMPPCGGAPLLERLDQEAELLVRLLRGSIPIASSTAYCTSGRLIRMLPPPISAPLMTMSYARARAAAGVVRRAAPSDSSVGEVKGWCSASQRPSSSFHSTQREVGHPDGLPVARRRQAEPRGQLAARSAPSVCAATPASSATSSSRSPGDASSAAAIARDLARRRGTSPPASASRRLALLDVGPHEPAGALPLGELDQPVQLRARQLVRAGVESAHDPAALEHAAEDLELRLAAARRRGRGSRARSAVSGRSVPKRAIASS